MSEQNTSMEEPVVEESQAKEAPVEGGLSDDAHLHMDKYESMWLKIAFIIMGVFFLSVIISSFAIGIQLPGAYARIDPTKVNDPGSPFADPGLRELAPGKYEAYYRAQIWQFTPREIHVPLGAEVSFFVTSQDVQHGFKISDTNVNVMVVPGQISTLKHTFDKPGEYKIICHEYCGQLHHTMFAQIFVDDPAEEVASGGQN